MTDKKKKSIKYGDQVKLIDRENCPKMMVSYVLPRWENFAWVYYIECMWFEKTGPLQRGVFKSTELTHY